MSTRDAIEELETRILALLADLGDTPAKVAATLAAKGIKGRRHEVCACPIYVYLHAEVPEVDHVGVDRVQFRPDPDVPGFIDLPLPPAVVSFIRQFDDGAHSALDPAVRS